MGDYFGFEDVMKELELGEEELKRMVSEGELRAFRDENKMKFKKEDVENLKKGRITEPTIILPSTPAGEPIDETVLDLDIGEETAALAKGAASEPTVDFNEIGSEKTSSELNPFDTDDDLLVTEASGSEIGSDTTETFIEEDADTGLSTEPIHLADDTAEETLEAEAVSEDADAFATAPPSRGRARRTGRTRMGRRVTAQVPMAVEHELEARPSSPLWAAVLFFTAILGLGSLVFFYDTLRLSSGEADRPIGLTAGTSKWILTDFFWNDAKWTGHHKKKYPAGGEPPYQDASQNPRLKFDEKVYRGPSFELPDDPPRGAPGQ